ncbi:hypothetical protein EGW08_010391 [Elysia chlorotica]|uniref:Cytochrome b561 domain-containing protein n=1 Tax=Elysia chlorotica TaxID=188477 RepID=A0A3S0ZST1_ELYCH|nr:hypothetical protein EGW08_010391 [Elysia chlorotica]
MILCGRGCLVPTLTIIIVCFILGIRGFPDGSPVSTCLTRYPIHGNVPAQTSQGPFVITLDPPTGYQGGDVIKVKISSSDGSQFSGFQIAAYRESCPAQIVGEFTKSLNQGKSKIFSCPGGVKNMITHSDDDHVSSIEFEWTAPSNSLGNIIFASTVLQHYETFWTDVTATLPSAATVTDTCSYQTVTPTSSVTAIDFSYCDNTKACFLYPITCEDSDCTAAVTFEYREATKDYKVEMYANPGPSVNYVGVAFSSDDEMGDDETFVCTTNELSLQYGYNPGKENEKLRYTDLFTEAEIRNEDGSVHCRFVMKEDYSLETIDPNTATSDTPTTITKSFSKSSGWRIQLAWGQVIEGSDVILMHKDMPPTTFSSVVIKEPGIYRGTAYPVLIKLHATFMMVAWILLSGLVTVIARHYREFMPKKRLFGTKVWFQMHRGLAVLVAILTVLAVIMIFAARGMITKAAAPHAVCGLIVVVFLILQIIAGILRPDLSDKRRIIFNWGHRILGNLTHLLAAITMFLAFKIDYVTESMRDFGYTTLGVWFGVQILWLIAFEVASCFLNKEEPPATDSYEMEGIKIEKVSWIPSVMMVFYILCLLACCISVMCAFLFY